MWSGARKENLVTLIFTWIQKRLFQSNCSQFMSLYRAVTSDFLSWKIRWPLGFSWTLYPLLLFMLLFLIWLLFFILVNVKFLNSNFKKIFLFLLKSYSLLLVLSLCLDKKEMEIIWLFIMCVCSCMHLFVYNHHHHKSCQAHEE